MSEYRVDTLSGTWLALSAWARAEIEDRRTRLENTGMSHERAQLLRGEILALRAMLAQGEPRTVLPDEGFVSG